MNSYDVIVVGGGPAGCTVACLLASRGISAVLLEEKRTSREKVCGSFITPESFPTLQRLGVLEQILEAGAQRISELTLVAPSGRELTTTISAISAAGTWALSLSRSRLDAILIDRARASGAACLEGMAAKRGLFKNGRAWGIECVSLPGGQSRVFKAPLVIDASGRNSRLSVSAAERSAGPKGSRLYALKAHFQNIDIPPERVELYFFQTGYGGISVVEGGLVNLCFMTTEKSIKESRGDAASVVQQTIMRNPGARRRLADARLVGKWLSAGPLSFGHRRLVRDGVIAVGDAAGMIDPFTGTGIQVALRSGETLADCILQALSNRDEHRRRYAEGSFSVGGGLSPAMGELADQVNRLYGARYRAEFGRRMVVAGALRFAAFSPRAPGLVASLFATAPGLVNRALRGTRLRNQRAEVPAALPDQIMELSAPDGVSTDNVGISQGR